MKKGMALLVCAVMILSLFGGCAETPADTTASETTAPAEPALSVGYGRTDITPTEPVRLAGWPGSEARTSESVTWPLYATCVALTDGEGQTVLVFHLDLISTGGSDMAFHRAAVAKATGVSIDHVIFAATHTHSGPQHTSSDLAIQRYNEALREWLVQAAEEAMADRKPAKMYTATAHTEGLNWIRYYEFSNGEVGSGSNDRTKLYKRVAHYGEPDRTLQMVKFTREGGKDVIMVNWQGHPSRDGGQTKTNVSSDIVGVMREYVEEKLDCQFAYFTGASGNVNNSSMIEASKDCKEQGEALGQCAVEAAAEFEELPLGKIQVVKQTFSGASKGNENVKVDFPITAFAIGDVGFVAAPYEMFDSSGRAIKEGSPFSMTMVLTCANGGYGYIPSEFAYTCFSSYEAESSDFASGTAEALESAFVSMLKQLKP